ncbi:NADPH-dependent F420 reductase [Streptomyces cyaneofuscatus]|uniref:NADPH-dependent F420 reductase n=1 Tax=Streptomyces cyaneofuscatus TaxID=66883 RepID=UPI003423CF9F
MRIGIIGTGSMADALGTSWARAGHDVLFGGRSPDRAQALAGRTGSRAGTPAEAAAFGDVTLLALPYDAVAGLLPSLGPLRDRALIDCTNAIGPGYTLTTTGGPGAARTIADATGARVVKAFNHLPAHLWATPQGPTTVPLCGDDEKALTLVGTLVRDLGHTPLTVGGLERAAYLETTTAFLIGLWHTGHDPRTLLPPLTAVRPEPRTP